ncbi:MAG: Trk system potassium transporter TrkA [Myxococcota bacterium]
MYIVVIGLGEVGRHLLSVLQHEGHDVVAVDRKASAVAYAAEHFDVATLEGYGASQEVLDQAGVGNADLVVAVSDNDEVNLIAALAAKQQGAKRVVARAQGNEWATWRQGIRHGLLGVDVVINPRVLVGQELGRVARSHGAIDVIDLAEDRVELVKMEMTSRMANKPLAKLTLPQETLIAAYVRDDELVVPGGADVLLPGDTVYLIGRPESILQAEDLFSTSREARRIMIVGGGVIGQALARQVLPHGAFVTIVERDEKIAEELAAKHDGLDVRLGDGTDQELLQNLEVESYDLCACVTQEDEVNLMAALIAKRSGVLRTAAVVQRADYGPIYRQLGIDIVLSPRTVASDHILQFCRGAAVHSVHVLEEGAAEVVEVTAQRGATIAGKPLRRVQLPKGALVCAIIRNGEVVVPRGDDTINPGDRTIVMASREARPSVERMFRGRGALRR